MRRLQRDGSKTGPTNRHFEVIAITAAAVLLSLMFLPSRRSPAQEEQLPSIRTTTSEVLLDFVVRDKHANIIRNLRPDQVQVFEDGVPQKLRHFEFFDGRIAENESPEPETTPAPAPVAAPTNTPPPKTVNELRDISMVSIVVANLDPRQRALTAQAMTEFVKTELKPNVYVGVFTLGEPGLNYVQNYTNDPQKIAAAVSKVTSSVVTLQLNGQLTQTSISDSGRELADVGGTAAGPQDSAPIGSGPGADLAAMDTSWTNDMRDAYMSSVMTLAPLRHFVDAQAVIPGRKVVLLFMSGLPVTTDTEEIRNGVVSAANRANVTFYALSPNLGYGNLNASRNALHAAANASMQQQMNKVSGGNQAVTPTQAAEFDVAESSIHANQQGELADLAEDTGGAMLPPTLDMREPLHKAMEDVRTHYELTYAPTNTSANGEFRKIEVKTSIPGAHVFARNGYYALPVLKGQQIYPFEMATMKALNTKPDLHQFDIHTAALEFRPGATRNQYDFIFQAQTKDLSIVEDKQWAKVHVAVTALIRDDKGQIVDKLSKDIPYDLPIATKGEMQKGIVSFTTPFLLPPGHYTIDTAAVDRNSMKAAVKRSTLDVEQDSGFAMSDVSVARRVDSIEGQPNALDPLQARGAAITPELGDVVTPDTAGALEFYAVAYPVAPVDAPVNVSFEIYQAGKLVMKSPPSAVSPDKNGAASILAKLPAGKLTPGSHYEADVLFQYKGERLMKKVDFTLAGAGVASN